MTPKIYLGIIAVLILVGAVYGAYLYPASTTVFVQGTSPQGSTGRTSTQANIYGVNLANPGANATSSSILNSSSNDYYITSLKVGCEGVGTSKTAYSGAALAALTLKVATSATAAIATNGNTNVVGGGAITIGTSTPNFVLSTTTASGGNNNVYNIWGAGTYLTFTFNATNTAVCTVAGDYTTS